MLIKTSLNVFVPGQPALAYRPYSKTCPAPVPVTPPKRWVTKTLCGTYTVYLYDVYTPDLTMKVWHVKKTQYVIAGLPTTSTFQGAPPEPGFPTTPVVAATGPYCVTVNVYE
ncbi:MAG: hypothetical protein V4641_05575 [Pseudomonadota bacterium]